MSNKKVKVIIPIISILITIISLIVVFQTRSQNQALQYELTAAYDKNTSIQSQLNIAIQDVQSAQQINSNLEEGMTELRLSYEALSYVEEGFADRIRQKYSSYDMTVLDTAQIGEDTSESVKRLYVCDGSYNYAEFYIVDYITGSITSLNRWAHSGYISHREKNEEGDYINMPFPHQLIIEDLDGDSEDDILFVMPFEDWGYRDKVKINIWLQRNGEFMPVNDTYCCNDKKNSVDYFNEVYNKNEFSQKISDFEEELKGNKDADTDYVIKWVKNELFSGNRELLEELLKEPGNIPHYTQLRQPSDMNVTVTLDENDEYHISISQNPYSEKEINMWLKNFYEDEEQRTYNFMGYGERDSETMTPEERERMGFYRSTSLSLKRADDAIISFWGGTYEYSGGAHGNSYYFGVSFDPRSGKYLTLEDIFIYDYLYTGELHRYIMEYIDENYNEYGWGQEHIRNALTGGGWCLTGYGFKIFLAGGNGGGEYEYDIPYELLVDYLRADYFPTDRSAEYLVYFSSSADNRAKMDINADGILDIITGEEKDDTLELSINGKISNLTFKNGEEIFSPHNGYFYLIRDKDGITRLEARLDYYREVSERDYAKYNVIFVYNIIDEQLIWVETHIYPEEQY